MNILPGILAKTLAELRNQVKRVTFAKKVHIDIIDGRFVKNKTIGLLTLKKALPAAEVQVHLMAYKPHTYINALARMGVQELIIHAEATPHLIETLHEIKEKGMKAGIAFNPETHVEHYKEALRISDSALIMTVHPGYSGQTFIEQPLRKIHMIKLLNKKITVGVDGGITKDTCKLSKKAHADFAVATSAVTLAPHPQNAYKELTRI